ncbi:MAG: 4-(cytidine 5'-diphospho)-2-C-methyl-D-erythritol kinase [Clostridia bacterium]|nr:4-(cytidine 5'-diphospho)-2-C-methyl-D-erythritol kinase [Clostridia bacterium]
MEEIYRKARAKINLSLDVVGKREDNYHNIESIFQKINLYDELYISKTQTNGIEIKTNVEELSSQDNIIYKTYQLLKERYKEITGVQVRLKKKIPMQAGLAGGSTDCASFLFGMNQLFDLKLSKAELEKIGKSLGADVVPCFYNTVKGEGIGEIITPIYTSLKYYLVIIKPKICCNTKEAFKKIDEQRNMKQSNNSNKIKEALEQNQLEIVANHLYNVFEEVIEEKELIETIKKELIQEGAVRKFDDWNRFLCVWNI